MSLLTLLRHRLKSYGRVPFLGRRLASLLVGAFLALYFGGSLVLAGVFFDNLVQNVAPSADPLLVAAKGLLPFGLGYAALRSVMESGLGVDPRPYQALPVPRSTLVGLLATFALFSLWNAVPLTFVAAVCVEMTLNGAGGAALRFGLACFGVLAAVTYAAPMLRQMASGRPVPAVATVGVFFGMIGIEAIDLSVGLVSLMDVSAWLLGGVVQGQVLPATVAVLGFVGLVGGYTRWLRGAMAVDHSPRRASSGGSSEWLARLARRGPAWREAVLEIRRWLRNKQLRLTLFLSPLMIGSMGFAGYAIHRLDAIDFNFFIIGLFGTGLHIVQGAPNMFSYEGDQLDAVQARPASIRNRMRGRWLMLALGALALFLLPLPAMLWRWSPFALLHTSFFLYNVGVLAPLMLAASTFNRMSVNANQHSMADSPGMTVSRLLLMFPAFALPVALYPFLEHTVVHLGLIGGLGLLSLGGFLLWLRGLTALYEYNRYAMLESFRTSREEG